MFGNILVPVDLSTKAERPVAVARDLARLHGAAVTLLHVIETLDAPRDELAEFYADLEARARRRLAELAATFPDPARVAGRITYGKRAREIVEFAEENDFDLVVMGSHRLTPDNFTTGFMTISHQVAIVCAAPVLVVKH